MSSAQFQQASSAAGRIHTVKGESPASQTKRAQGSDQKPLKSSNPESRDAPGQAEEENIIPRDAITGRPLAEDGGSCLRCIEKGLRCTLNFLGVEGEAKCAACRRSGSQYCIRQRGPEKRIEFQGAPWDNPNYFTVGDKLSPLEMKKILYEHYLGEEKYLYGTYLHEAERKQVALPPFNGSDLPIEKRPENWKTADWRSVLPIWKNRSLHPRPIMQRSQSEIKRRDGASTGSQPTVLEASPSYITEDTIRYLRLIRKYEPRAAHLKEHINDALGETW
ncbi:hypothetical protein F5Y05DRAFT_418183 [Hypoxylon sp. FL0543]|nr:hypothetical protein F5Y05DRAFT_418183 [Hypoxylon sp. FL0543]